MRLTLTLVVEKDPDGGFVGSIVELPGCHTQGDSLDELRANLREAIALFTDDEGFRADLLPNVVAIERIRVHG